MVSVLSGRSLRDAHLSDDPPVHGKRMHIVIPGPAKPNLQKLTVASPSCFWHAGKLISRPPIKASSTTSLGLRTGNQFCDRWAFPRLSRSGRKTKSILKILPINRVAIPDTVPMLDEVVERLVDGGGGSTRLSNQEHGVGNATEPLSHPLVNIASFHATAPVTDPFLALFRQQPRQLLFNSPQIHRYRVSPGSKPIARESR